MEIKPIGAGGIYSPSAIRANAGKTNDNNPGSPEGIRLNDRYEPSVSAKEKTETSRSDVNKDKVTFMTVNTDKVDRELNVLKEKKQDLEQSVIRENDSRRRKLLERSLKRLSSEITRRDNDAYRRRHADIS